MSVADLRLPTPLLDPQAWPVGRELLISIFALGWGGPIEQRIRLADQITIEAPTHFWNQAQSIVLKDAFESLKRVRPNTELKLVTETSSLKSWALALFPLTRSKLDEVSFQRKLEEFQKTLSPDFVSLETFGFFPGFLRQSKAPSSEVWETAAQEYAQAAVLFSPQKDQEGAGEFLIANPTVEIPQVSPQSKRPLTAYARVGQQVRALHLSWEMAAIFDELREEGKVQRSKLLYELENKSFALHKTSSFASVIDQLVKDGFLQLREI